jgi:hypothetical protein
MGHSLVKNDLLDGSVKSEDGCVRMRDNRYECPRCKAYATICYGHVMDIDMTKRWGGFGDLFEWECKECGLFWLQRKHDEREKNDT